MAIAELSMVKKVHLLPLKRKQSLPNANQKDEKTAQGC